MANVTVNFSAAFAQNGNTFPGTFLANSPRGFAANDDSSVRFSSGFFDTDQNVTLAGTGLSFVRGSGGVEAVLSGRFTTLTYTYHDEVVVRMAGLRVDAPGLFAEIRDRDAGGILNLLLAGADKIIGSRGVDGLYGFAGADKLFGDSGSDTLDGGAGRDVLHGDGGKDELVGGADDDRFVFDTAPARNNVDSIIDFNTGEDQLQFDRDVFRGAGSARDISADAFVLGTRAQDGEDRFIYQQSTGKLWFDRNGDAAGGQKLVVTLHAGAGLTADDIGLI